MEGRRGAEVGGGEIGGDEEGAGWFVGGRRFEICGDGGGRVMVAHPEWEADKGGDGGGGILDVELGFEGGDGEGVEGGEVEG